MEKPLSEQEHIAIVAHRIYEEEGCPPDRADEHWARAEREGVSAEALVPPEEIVP